jgi:hypothetical protein
MRYWTALIACVFTVRLFGSAPTTAPYECHRANKPITLDGRADEPDWKHAAIIDGFQQGWRADKTPKTHTKAMLLWDDTYLYFFADMVDEDLFAFGSHHQDTLWKGDVFELFFKPSPDKDAYYEFEVNPKNLTLELAFPDRNAVHHFPKIAAETKIKMETAVTVRGSVNDPSDKDQGWSVEGRISWRDLSATGGKPKPNAEWKFALCRCDHSNPPSDYEELSSSAPLKKPSFHRLDDYTTIKFSDAP